MRDFNSVHDPNKVYSNFKQSTSDNQTKPHDNKHPNSKIALILTTNLGKLSLLATLIDINFDNLCTSCIAGK